MNKLIFPFLLLWIYLPASAQQEAAKEKNTYEVGLNTTTFINNFFSPNDLSPGVGAYLLSMRIYRPGKKVLRMGLNINVNRFETKPHLDGKRITNRYQTDFRFGWEKQIAIHKRWTMLTGIDITSGLFGNYTNVEQEILGNSKTTSESVQLGVGPTLGIQFNITEKIGVFTESTMYLKYRYSVDKTEVFDNDSTRDYLSNLNFNISLPTALFFFMKF